jgi:hypothetical protein
MNKENQQEIKPEFLNFFQRIPLLLYQYPRLHWIKEKDI